MNYIKIVSKGWAGYTGQLNIITFKNGISTEPVPQFVLDRIAAVTQVVACDAEGNEVDEGNHLGIQNRMVGGVTLRAPIAEPLRRQTDEEKALEQRVDQSKVLAMPIDKLYTRAELEALADKGGLKSLREIGDKWKVRSKAIADLIERILVVQDRYLKERNALAEKTPMHTRKHTLVMEDEVKPVQLVEEPIVPAGCEGLAPEYFVDEAIIPAATIISSALKNSGKSLTGWNNLPDAERKEMIDAEIAALEEHFGKKLSEVNPDQEKAEEPKSDGE